MFALPCGGSEPQGKMVQNAYAVLAYRGARERQWKSTILCAIGIFRSHGTETQSRRHFMSAPEPVKYATCISSAKNLSNGSYTLAPGVP